MPAVNDVDVDIRRDQDLLCGRLIAFPGTIATPTMTAEQRLQSARDVGPNRFISIDFPAMPDTIELARTADYMVSSFPISPDGMHQYKGTKPMDIPISFRIHSFDRQFCPRGALTLLQLAARLHAFILPISTLGRAGRVIADYTTTGNTTGQPNAAALAAAAGNAQTKKLKVTGQQGGAVYSPVTCWLHLMWIGDAQPGISCVGYIREVSVKFNGPWLRGPNRSFNLPTSADFSFTFVHFPGQSNSQEFSTSQTPNTLSEAGQWYADDVRERLYNNRDLIYAVNYQGFTNNEAGTTRDPAANPPIGAPALPAPPPVPLPPIVPEPPPASVPSPLPTTPVTPDTTTFENLRPDQV